MGVVANVTTDFLWGVYCGMVIFTIGLILWRGGRL